ncbi:MAG: SIS domain-containing protein [Candidatus Omnitrophica bacterium]|nr:SIS domain-containing protein [Candidatus Omnitrophota bacterium]
MPTATRRQPTPRPASDAELIDSYIDAMGTLMKGVPRATIQRAVDLLFDAWQRHAAIYVAGNGGSASTASHFASDLAKFTIAEGRPRFKVVSLTDNVPLVSAWTNDSGFGSIFAEQMEPWFQAGDGLVAFSVHGGSGSGEAGPWSQNLTRAVTLAKQRRGFVIGFSGFDGGMLKAEADACMVVPASQEPMATPLVESLHVALHHLVCVALKVRIAGRA